MIPRLDVIDVQFSSVCCFLGSSPGRWNNILKPWIHTMENIFIDFSQMLGVNILGPSQFNVKICCFLVQTRTGLCQVHASPPRTPWGIVPLQGRTGVFRVPTLTSSGFSLFPPSPEDTQSPAPALVPISPVYTDVLRQRQLCRLGLYPGILVFSQNLAQQFLSSL